MDTKIALVTGGSRGLGKEMALSFGKKGVDVILTYHTNKEEAEKVVAQLTASGRKAAALQLDMADFQSLEGFVKNVRDTLQTNWHTGSFDYLVNNAGIGATVPIPQVTEELFDRMMNIHFKGIFFLTQLLLPSVNDHGSIVNISSGTTRFCIPGYSVYSSMKSALETFTRYLSKETGPRGIRANVVAPGATETDFNGAIIRSNPQTKAFISSQTPLGRVAQADDIGHVVTFLCSDEARWINGQRIEVSGGIN